MEFKRFLPLLLTCLVFAFAECQVDYTGYQVFRVNATQTRPFEAIKNLFLKDELDFWSPPSKLEMTDILIPPRQNTLFRAYLNSLGTPYTVLIENLQYAIEYERLNYVAEPPSVRSEMDWTSYQRLQTIHDWMDSLAEKYPNVVTLYTAGNSTEGRPLKIMKISTGPARADKPAIWIDGGIHAREWISPATVTYIANELVTHATRYRNSRLTNYFDFYIDPVMNPDGYEYTRVDRLWRKTRSGPRPVVGGFLGWCRGVDPNRNWDFQWAGKGTSDNPCSQVYHGPEAASEPEVSSIQNFVYERKDNIKLFLTFHSYSQLLLLPWSYDEIRTDDYDDLMSVGNKAMKALESVHGTEYKGGPTAEILYAAAGGSHDWAKGVAGIKFAYCYELRDTGDYGFLLPANQIIPSGEETFVAVNSMVEDMIDFYKLDPESESSTVPAGEGDNTNSSATDAPRLYQRPLEYVKALYKNENLFRGH